VGKISNALEKYRQERKQEREGAARVPEMKPEDWDVLMLYDKRTGKLDLHNRKVIKDPGTIHRLLANRLILSDGSLTHSGRKKCEAFREEKRIELAGEERREPARVSETVAAEKPIDSERDDHRIEEDAREIEAAVQTGELRDSDLTILMSYDRNTGHLLTYENNTGELESKSLEVLRDRGVLQRLLNAGHFFESDLALKIIWRVVVNQVRKVSQVQHGVNAVATHHLFHEIVRNISIISFESFEEAGRVFTPMQR